MLEMATTDSGELAESDKQPSLPALMARHHPIHGLFGQAFEEVGGIKRLVQWADENFDDFVKIFARMAPPPQFDISARQVNIQVNNALRRAPLDHE